MANSNETYREYLNFQPKNSKIVVYVVPSRLLRLFSSFESYLVFLQKNEKKKLNKNYTLKNCFLPTGILNNAVSE